MPWQGHSSPWSTLMSQTRADSQLSQTPLAHKHCNTHGCNALQVQWITCHPLHLSKLLCVQMHEQKHTPAFYEERDSSRRATEFANEAFVLPTDSLRELPPFDGALDSALAFRARCRRLECPRPSTVGPSFLRLLLFACISGECIALVRQEFFHELVDVAPLFCREVKISSTSSWMWPPLFCREVYT